MWKTEKGNPESNFYSIICSDPLDHGMENLKELFPEGEADELNFVLFSTSGIHGSYQTIEDVEEDWNNTKDEYGEEISRAITFLVVHPRLVTLRYGLCVPESKEDLEFLRKLRKSSSDQVAKIGVL